jgi:hypothetical protein
MFDAGKNSFANTTSSLLSCASKIIDELYIHLDFLLFDCKE